MHVSCGDLNLVVQCKNMAKRLGPQYVRELEATVADFAADSPPGGIIGLLSSSQGFTKQAMARAMSASHPVALMEQPAGGPLPSSIILNPPASMALPRGWAVAPAPRAAAVGAWDALRLAGHVEVAIQPPAYASVRFVHRAP